MGAANYEQKIGHFRSYGLRRTAGTGCAFANPQQITAVTGCKTAILRLKAEVDAGILSVCTLWYGIKGGTPIVQKLILKF